LIAGPKRRTFIRELELQRRLTVDKLAEHAPTWRSIRWGGSWIGRTGP
jgi:hypothetical protein